MGAQEEQPAPFTVAFARAHPFGHLVGVHLPTTPTPAPLDRLSASERTFAEALRGFRVVEWVGGRLAAKLAARHFDAVGWALEVGARGEPVPPPGFSVSISHKRGLAIALVSNVAGDEIGIDLEDDVAAATAIEELVFTDNERAGFDALRTDLRGNARVLAFALKEATWKARSARLDLRYSDAEVTVNSRTNASVRLRVENDTPLDVAIEWHGRFVIAAVRGARRIRPGSPSNTAR